MEVVSQGMGHLETTIKGETVILTTQVVDQGIAVILEVELPLQLVQVPVLPVTEKIEVDMGVLGGPLVMVVMVLAVVMVQELTIVTVAIAILVGAQVLGVDIIMVVAGRSIGIGWGNTTLHIHYKY